MRTSRRAFLGTLAAGSAVSLSGCTEGVLVETAYDCDVDEPTTTPHTGQPHIGQQSAPVSVEVFHDLSNRPTWAFTTHALSAILNDYVDTGAAQVEFYDLPVPGDPDWAHQLASVARYIHAEAGQDAYQAYIETAAELFSSDQPTWQGVGDAASAAGVDPCTAIAHGSWKTYEADTEADRRYAHSLEIDAVPALLIDGQRLADISPVNRSEGKISAAIDRALGTDSGRK